MAFLDVFPEFLIPKSFLSEINSYINYLAV